MLMPFAHLIAVAVVSLVMKRHCLGRTERAPNNVLKPMTMAITGYICQNAQRCMQICMLHGYLIWL